ncbi:MAG: hypothetical protein AAF988_08440 [Pseudomonadota bacterium]
MSQTDQIIARFQDLTSFIEDAQDRLADGEVINLSHLDNEVEELCQAAISLPPEEAQKVQEPMAVMIGKLETLGAALKDFQESLKKDHDL